jgi:hypothetical protein
MNTLPKRWLRIAIFGAFAALRILQPLAPEDVANALNHVPAVSQIYYADLADDAAQSNTIFHHVATSATASGSAVFANTG